MNTETLGEIVERDQNKKEVLRMTLSFIEEEKVLAKARLLRKLYLNGKLGGEVMPEDSNPNLPRDSALNYLYFTLPMALNYQRNSYSLWAATLNAFNDQETRPIYNLQFVVSTEMENLSKLLTKHQVALQPIKHCATWNTLSRTIIKHFDGDLRNLFAICNWNVPQLLEYVQRTHKRDFPYLSGPKICNYWLYVISNYTDASLSGLEHLSIAPDTHVIQASIRLGIIDENISSESNIQSNVNNAWKSILSGTELTLIDLHTPLWLWSRGGFKELVD